MTKREKEELSAETRVLVDVLEVIVTRKHQSDAEHLKSIAMKVKPDFLTPKLSRRYSLHRYDRLDSRYYFEFFRNGGRIPYMSITSMIDKLLPKGKGYENWLVNKGVEAENIRDESAEFGTVMHILCTEILANGGKGSFDIDKRLYDLLPVRHHPRIPYWVRGMKISLASWAQFVSERIVEVLAIEIPLRSRKYGFAMTADVVAKIKFGKKIVVAGIDLKSVQFYAGKTSKVFFDANELQLVALMNVWNENYVKPEYKMTHVFNWCPTMWKKEVPTFKFDNQTNSKYFKVFKEYMKIAKVMELSKPPSKISDITGDFDVKDFNINKHLKTYEI